jgi:SAM-dependent methyltransferase
VHVGSLESVPCEPGSLDFIHMRHVIEHVEDPVGLLRRAFELLRPGGWLYVETPNIESYPAATCGTYWFGVDSPRHLWLFGPDTLRRCLAASGFELERMWSFVVIRLCSWESTYRREDGLSRQLRWRPSVGVRDMGRALSLGVRSRAKVHTDKLSGDIVACWARKPDATAADSSP